MPQADIVRVWLRMLLVAWPLALALGACTLVQAEPVDRTVIGPLSPIQPAIPNTFVTQPPENGAWHLRLTRL
ncbi:hypothetical protein MKK75_04575 [Methylobacterium sp. J-030]|uniref:hypothetical protein n=1 Tax=Methylobacterium sp. J-030 TaxID=2836627 RepID=UPI001FBA39BD|nr:hypothetical protein [Methylobacterium sp. J-030]MCJ2068090.1 hypothetical protein [Methylobacterium sp. J-030]